ncbi:zinc finger protein 687a-like [Battus philenor]|uniref:zinc finger protein 687a-like n=1 Tax=Battus philenor TaxID=42288 RepID=UPI0035D0EFFE
MADKNIIKTLLFSKPIPNYIIPIRTYGHKLFSCHDCGDRFILESSYDYHINRKSVKITYNCRHCGGLKLFFNRCNLLSHIRSHVFKTATINVSDLKIEPFLPVSTEEESQNDCPLLNKSLLSRNSTCYECKADNTRTGIAYKDRATHYMQFSNALVYSCPICMFTLPTICAIKAHLRIHLKRPPFYCPECGIQLDTKSVHYPYGHDCEGFKMMRATARLYCSTENCSIFHPNEYNNHMKTLHLKKIYKCPSCLECSYNESVLCTTHLEIHKHEIKPICYYQCQKCSGKFIIANHVNKHLKTHIKNYVYPCWTCGKIFKEATILISHHVNNHSQKINITKQLCASILNEDTNINTGKKKIKLCKQNFTFNKKQNEVNLVAIECPNKLLSLSKQHATKTKIIDKSRIICPLCKNHISQNWEKIKKHYYKFHKSFKCVDIKITLQKLDKKDYTTKRSILKKILLKETYRRDTSYVKRSTCFQNSNNLFLCQICNLQNKDMESLDMHMREHRDPYMAYQCMECGQNFAVKPSFSTHLLLEHSISDAVDYIDRKQCFNEKALIKNKRPEIISDNKPLKENQCQICRELFDNSDNLRKHFRVHGMAFLMKNTSKGNNV